MALKTTSMGEDSKKTERDITQDLISKSEDLFENKLTYIAAGALLLSLTLLEKIISFDNSRQIHLIIIGWIILVLTLMINLTSHMVSKILFRKALKEFDAKVNYHVRYSHYKKGLIISEGFNWASVFTLVAGICLIIFFVSSNALHPINSKHSEKGIKDTTNSKCLTVKK